MNPPRLFKPTRRHWREALGPFSMFLIFFFLTIVSAIVKPENDRAIYAMIVLLALILVWGFFVNLRPLLRTEIRTDEESISGRINGAAFRIYWHNVRAVENNAGSLVMLVLRSGVVRLDLCFLDAEAVKAEIRAHIPPGALETVAFYYWLEYGTAPYDYPPDPPTPGPLPVVPQPLELRAPSPWGFLLIVPPLGCLISLLTVLYYASQGVLWYSSGGFTISLLLLFISAFLIRLLPQILPQSPGKLRLDSESFDFTDRRGETYRIRWDELLGVELNQYGLTLYGSNKWITLPKVVFSNWTGPQRGALWEFFRAQMKYRQLAPAHNRESRASTSSENARIFPVSLKNQP